MMDYEEMLLLANEIVIRIANGAWEKEEEIEQYNFKKGRLKGYAEGLMMALTILSRTEQKMKKKAQGVE